MKYTIIIIATVALLTCQSKTAHCQIIKSSKNMNTVIMNEHWFFSEGFEGYRMNYSEFTFYETGTFEHHFGYSGGINIENRSRGRYEYDADKKTIKLEIDNPKDFGGDLGSVFLTPPEISIMEITDNSVTIDHGNGKIITMRRKTGIISDQHWYPGENSSRDNFRFSTDGRGKRYFNAGSVSDFIGTTYWYEYSIVDNILYLEIEGRQVDRAEEGTLFSPPKKTFIRLNMGNETVKVEKIDFEKIKHGTRDWQFKDGKHIITNDKELKKEIVWEEYNRVKMNKK
jgi:hypothetical protein